MALDQDLRGNGQRPLKGRVKELIADRDVDYLLILRGFATCGVVLSHIASFGPHSLSNYIFRATGGAYDYVAYARSHGLFRTMMAALTPLDATSFVLLFFVLSGYLMGKVFFTGHYQVIGGLMHFYKARYLRLAPLLYFNLFVCVCLYSRANLDPIKALGDILFITNVTDRGINPVSWSLSIEMQYYLICPFVYLFLRKQNRTSLVGALLLSVLAFVAQHILDPNNQFFYTYVFLLGFSVNQLLSVFRPQIGERTKRVVILVLILLLGPSAGFLRYMGYHNEGPVVSAAVMATLLVYVSELPIKGLPARTGAVESISLRFFMFTGLLSYGIYLWHYAIIATRYADVDSVAVTVAHALGLARDWQVMLTFNALQIPMIFGLSIALAYLTFVTIETRFRPGLYSFKARHAEPIRPQN